MLETLLFCTLGAIIGTTISASVYYAIIFIKKTIKKHIDK